jgi:hypothetical protein
VCVNLPKGVRYLGVKYFLSLIAGGWGLEGGGTCKVFLRWCVRCEWCR